MKLLPIGRSDFKEIIEENNYFVDKSLFIKEIINDSSKIILLPRPRRFGKTLNLTMLRHFFGKTENKEDTAKLFKNLAIEKEPEFKTHLGKYPLIFLTFKDVKAPDFNHSMETIKRLIADEFGTHRYLLESDALEQEEKENFDNILKLKAAPSAYELALKDLSQYLHKYHKEKPVILIDEYDTPIHTAFEAGYYYDTISFFKGFLGAGLKDNYSVFKGVLTGILRVSRESIFTDLNNLGVYSVLDSEYSSYFGFTEDEVITILKTYNCFDKIDDVRTWYDGYLFGNKRIYNPWSILRFTSSIDKSFKPFWANTSSNEILRDLIKNAPAGVKESLRDLLKDIPVQTRLNKNVVFRDLEKDELTIYSFLTFSGYLKAYDKEHKENKDYYKLLIPNLEVKQIFEDIIEKWISESFENHKLKIMLEGLVSGDTDLFEEILGDFIIDTLSYFDTQKQKDVEKVYQAFILGMLVNLTGYEVNSERESGFGRYDISIIPKDKSKMAVIMELKVRRKKETTQNALDSALKQIYARKYEKGILKTGIKDILKIGVVFDGKRVWVQKG